MKPLLDRVVIRREVVPVDENATIVVPEMYRQQSRWGHVVAIGQYVVLGTQAYPLTDFVNVGDRVYFGEYNAEPVTINDEELLIVRIQDVRLAR